jgi:hypothetical protein
VKRTQHGVREHASRPFTTLSEDQRAQSITCYARFRLPPHRMMAYMNTRDVADAPHMTKVKKFFMSRQLLPPWNNSFGEHAHNVVWVNMRHVRCTPNIPWGRWAHVIRAAVATTCSTQCEKARVTSCHAYHSVSQHHAMAQARTRHTRAAAAASQVSLSGRTHVL